MDVIAAARDAERPIRRSQAATGWGAGCSRSILGWFARLLQKLDRYRAEPAGDREADAEIEDRDELARRDALWRSERQDVFR
jgi:hypothetical protein